MAAARGRLDAVEVHQNQKRIIGNNAGTASSSDTLIAIRARLARQSKANKSISGTALLSRHDEGKNISDTRTNGQSLAVQKRNAPSATLLAALEDESKVSISEYYGRDPTEEIVAEEYDRNRAQSAAASHSVLDESCIYNTVHVGDMVYARHATDTDGRYLKGKVKAVIHKGFRSARCDVDIGAGRIINVSWKDIKYADDSAKGRVVSEGSGNERDWIGRDSHRNHDEDEIDSFGRSKSLKAQRIGNLPAQPVKSDTPSILTILPAAEHRSSDADPIAPPPAASAGLVVSDAVLNMTKGGWKKKQL
jgi:hypothetical protein